MIIEYKGHEATLEVSSVIFEWYSTFAYDSYYNYKYTVTFKSPLIQCRSASLNTRELQLIKALYTKWWEQAIDKL